jgi:hypothetical protein
MLADAILAMLGFACQYNLRHSSIHRLLSVAVIGEDILSI